MTPKDMWRKLTAAKYGTFSELFSVARQIVEQNADTPPETMKAYISNSLGLGNMWTANPFVRNTRVKGISTLPGDFSKSEVVDMLKNPNNSERPLRQVEHGLEWTAYPLFHTRTTYQNLLTYHNFVMPSLTEQDKLSDKEFMREWRLCDKLRKAFNLKAFAHEAAGIALQEGKVFYHPRYSVDKAHNKINYAFMQQLPSDYCKIVGFNNKTKYTVAFDLMYFAQYGTDYRDYGDLFAPYFDDFYSTLYPAPERRGGRIINGAKAKIDLAGVDRRTADAYFANGRWFYWVTLPTTVFTVEADDTSRLAASPLAALFVDIIQLAQLQNIQLDLVQNPLVSCLTGEIPYFNERDTNAADSYKLSNAGVDYFRDLFYTMLAQNNTGGIGFYAAPLENMKLHTLAEAPSAMDIVSKGYSDTVAKAGLTGIMPTGDTARAGQAQVTLLLESYFLYPVYASVERAMNYIYETLNLKYEWEFRMFGTLAEDEKLKEEALRSMERGILPAAVIYNAIYDRSILDDICWSGAIMESGLMDLRMPLITSYSAKNEYGNLPPQNDKGGRPSSEGEATSEGAEQDVDSPPTRDEI